MRVVSHRVALCRNWSYEDLVEQELAAILTSAGGSVDESSADDDGARSSGGS